MVLVIVELSGCKYIPVCFLFRWSTVVKVGPINLSPPLVFVASGTQAALSHVRARGRLCESKADWSAISLEEYLEYVDRVIPLAAQDIDALDDVEQMTALKEKRNLTDVFLEKRRVVNGVKVRILIKVSLYRRRILVYPLKMLPGM